MASLSWLASAGAIGVGTSAGSGALWLRMLNVFQSAPGQCSKSSWLQCACHVQIPPLNSLPPLCAPFGAYDTCLQREHCLQRSVHAARSEPWAFASDTLMRQQPEDEVSCRGSNWRCVRGQCKRAQKPASAVLWCIGRLLAGRRLQEEQEVDGCVSPRGMAQHTLLRLVFLLVPEV
jgi:hypothetical protein